MSSASTKIIQAAAGNAGEALYVEDVFSTYLYTGTGSNRTVTNGIDLDGEGGLVWIKNRDRSSGTDHVLFDTERGTNKELHSNTTDAEDTSGSSLSAFNSNGFDIDGFANNLNSNDSGADSYVSWTFRKAPKFFDVVTWTGNGVDGRQVSHNLGSTPGCVMLKRTSGGTANWKVWHRSVPVATGGSFPGEQSLAALNQSVGFSGSPDRIDDVTSTYIELGTDKEVNLSGSGYVAYLFAHNNSDGEYGDNSDQDIIKCGSYTGGGAGVNVTVNLGWEPQWILVKNTSATGDWYIVDTMRGLTVSTDEVVLSPNLSAAEDNKGCYVPTATGFYTNSNAPVNISGNTYIYIAIRRGPMKTPESATEVFAQDYRHNATPAYTSGFPVDWSFQKRETGTSTTVRTRLLGTKYLEADSTGAEQTLSTITWDHMEGMESHTSAQTDKWMWMFRRAPGFFDVVAYTGDGVGPRNVPHSLGVVPEMMINKDRTQSGSWFIYHKDLPLDSATQTASLLFDDQPPGGYGAWGEHSGQTATTFEIAPSNDPEGNNKLGNAHITYLFATVPGVSKVGSYTGNGSSQTIDCGFSTGARFVLIKRTDSTSNWNLFDTERGIVAGNDPRLELNTTDAEDTGDDGVDPDSSGFAVNYIATNDDDVNVSGGTYIFLAIA